MASSNIKETSITSLERACRRIKQSLTHPKCSKNLHTPSPHDYGISAYYRTVTENDAMADNMLRNIQSESGRMPKVDGDCGCHDMPHPQ